MGLLINLSTLLVSKRNYFCAGLIAPHGEIAYNVYAHNSIGINNQRLEHVLELQRTQQRLIDYHELSENMLQKMPDEYRSVNDTIGYGVVLGILWKLSHSCSYNDMRYLQILLFCMALMYLYAIGLLIFNNANYALLQSLFFLSLHAVVFINVRALRDSWALYGLIILVHDFLSFYYTQQSSLSLKQYGHYVFFCLCVWLRPTLVCTLLGFGILCCLWPKRIGRLWLIYVTSTLFLFFLPFCLYNKHAYNHYFVSCAGHDLLAGLGEFSNPWGIKLSDSWVAEHIFSKYKLPAGTTEYDMQCTTEFMQYIKERPLVYSFQLLRRSLQLIVFYGMIHEWQEYDYCLQHATSALKQWIIKTLYALDCLQRTLYLGCWYVLLGWIGIILLFINKRFYEASIITLCALSGANKFFSHLETRYLVAHYSFFCIGITYLLMIIYDRLVRMVAYRAPKGSHCIKGSKHRNTLNQRGKKQ